MNAFRLWPALLLPLNLVVLIATSPPRDSVSSLDEQVLVSVDAEAPVQVIPLMIATPAIANSSTLQIYWSGANRGADGALAVYVLDDPEAELPAPEDAVLLWDLASGTEQSGFGSIELLQSPTQALTLGVVLEEGGPFDGELSFVVDSVVGVGNLGDVPAPVVVVQ